MHTAIQMPANAALHSNTLLSSASASSIQGGRMSDQNTRYFRGLWRFLNGQNNSNGPPGIDTNIHNPMRSCFPPGKPTLRQHSFEKLSSH